MPPRRSSRSTRSSVEPQVVEKAPPKRKRSEPPEDIADQENIKPRSRTRKPASTASTTKARASSRTSRSLQEVRESDEEVEEDVPPPVKKSRPSVEAENDSDDEIVEVKPPPRAKRAPSKRASSVKQEPLSAAPPRAATRSSGRTSRSTMKVEKDQEFIVISEDEVEEVPKPARKGRKVAAPRKKQVVLLSDSEEEKAPPPVLEPQEPEADPEVKPSIVPQEEEDEDGEDSREEMKELISSPARQERQEASEEEDSAEVTADIGQGSADEAAVEAEEQDHSLLDAPKSPLPQPQTQPSIPEEPQGPKSRLVIHKMALINFKSYAGRQDIGPFHKSFSSIVGPNGSGKSNTIDALLFVFGYRASKMRQGKISELIHNSARYPDLDECSVEVHFREIVDLPGPDAFEVVPDSQLVVARTAYKNNSSKYTINGRQSNYKEVQALLKSRGIDLDHNRFLILQGEVESIAQMKPKAPSEHEDGLLEYLEDIIGTSKYKEPIDAALVEMERLSEDRVEKMGRLKIVERERNALEAKKREAENYLRAVNDHVRAVSRLWQWYVWKCLLNEQEYDKKISKTEKDLAEETERNRDDVTHLEMLETHYKKRCAAYEEVKAMAAEAVKDLAAREKQQVSLGEKRKHASSKAKKLKKSLQDDEHARHETLRSIESNADKMEKEKQHLEELETSLAAEEDVLEEIRDSLKDKTQVFHDQIEVKQRELQPWTAKINAKQAEIDLASSEREMLAKKADAAKAASQEAQENLEQLQADYKAKTAELDRLKTSKSNKQQEIKEGERHLQDIRARVQELRVRASSSRQKAEEAKASQAASHSNNRVLDSLTRLRTAGRISGFHGRLGSLGTIDEKYDIAVSTACTALHNLVVDTVDQGQACIEYLRKQNIGRASFIVLEKLPNSNLEKISTPENVPRLFDLIKPKDQRFAPAFFKGVYNTLVANDLDQANRIAFGGTRRWRVVTLAGQLIDSSGTMSGGGNHVQRGGMSSKLAAEAVSPEVLKGYERDSEQAAQELEQALQQLRDVEAQLEGLTRGAPQLGIEIEKASLDIQTSARRIAELEKRVRELKSKLKPDAGDVARIVQLEEDIAAWTEELESLQERTGTIEEEIQSLEKKILEIGGARLLSQKSKVDGIRLHIGLANDEITKAEVGKAKAEKDSVKLESTITANTTAHEEIEAELAELNGELKEVEDYVAQIREKVDEAQSAADNSKEDLENLKNELDTKTEEIQAFRQKEMELTQILTDIKKEAAENDSRLEHWRSEHDKLKLEEIDGDDDEEEEPEEGETGPTESEVKSESGSAPNRKRSPSSELHLYSEQELATFKKRDMVADAEFLDEKVKNSKADLNVLKDYRKREEEFLRRAQDVEEVTSLRDGKKQEYDGLRKQRLDEFMTGFSMISLKLKEMYQMITLGGNAELELVDSMDPFSEGIIFSVMPPKKSWRNISNLSGGEKTLSSLALVFALHVYKPTPLYFMDEIDAALDFRNVSIVANYIKDRTKNAQFIIISLRNDMFELSHRLIGIYKTANATRSISIDNHPLHAVPLNAVPS